MSCRAGAGLCSCSGASSTQLHYGHQRALTSLHFTPGGSEPDFEELHLIWRNTLSIWLANKCIYIKQIYTKTLTKVLFDWLFMMTIHDESQVLLWGKKYFPYDLYLPKRQVWQQIPVKMKRFRQTLHTHCEACRVDFLQEQRHLIFSPFHMVCGGHKKSRYVAQRVKTWILRLCEIRL